jgi:hypothetical protein
MSVTDTLTATTLTGTTIKDFSTISGSSTSTGSFGRVEATRLSGDGADITGISAGISHDGSTADGVLTYKDGDEATVESNLTFDGTHLTLGGTSGSIILPAGGGINFAAQTGDAGGMTSELLDDYEEGTWTPQYQCNLGTGGDSNWGTYIKIGKLVYFEGYLSLLNTDWSAGSDMFLIGIPFVATSNPAKLVCDTDQWGNYHPQRGRINSTYIQLQYFTGNTDGYDFVRGSDTADGGDHNQMWFAGSYRST